MTPSRLSSAGRRHTAYHSRRERKTTSRTRLPFLSGACCHAWRPCGGAGGKTIVEPWLRAIARNAFGWFRCARASISLLFICFAFCGQYVLADRISTLTRSRSDIPRHRQYAAAADREAGEGVTPWRFLPLPISLLIGRQADSRFSVAEEETDGAGRTTWRCLDGERRRQLA